MSMLAKSPDKPAMLTYDFNVVDLHDLPNLEPKRKKDLFGVLDYFIRAQATLHHAEYDGEVSSLEENIERRGNTFRGVVIYTRDKLPVAYAVYYPMINGAGERGNYIEDAFLEPNFRNRGLMQSLVYQQIAKRTLDEGATFMQWSTDKRNHPFHGFSTKLGAISGDLLTLSTSDLLLESFQPPVSLLEAWKQTQFVTIPIMANHVNALKYLEISADMIRKTGDIDFKGFATFRADNLSKPIAITPGWPHMSTFRQKHGLYLEPTKFHPNEYLSDDDKRAITASCAQALMTYAQANSFSYSKWHARNNGQDLQAAMLMADLGFHVDSMLGTQESEMVVYSLRNGKLLELSEVEGRKSVIIPSDQPIGNSPRVIRSLAPVLSPTSAS
jgi:hypothetical protein